MAVGKNFLENLTVAMYENSFTVYREFVQNAADSIDKAIASKLAEPDDFYIDIYTNILSEEFVYMIMHVAYRYIYLRKECWM